MKDDVEDDGASIVRYIRTIVIQSSTYGWIPYLPAESEIVVSCDTSTHSPTATVNGRKTQP